MLCVDGWGWSPQCSFLYVFVSYTNNKGRILRPLLLHGGLNVNVAKQMLVMFLCRERAKLPAM
jgi:hypothetical protein